MTQELVLQILRQMMLLALELAGPVLAAGLVVGLVVAVVQAATQIQESTLTFVPKILVVGLVLVLLGPLALDRLVSFTTSMITEIAELAPGGRR